MGTTMSESFVEELKPYMSKTGYARLSEMEKTALLGVDQHEMEFMGDMGLKLLGMLLPLGVIAGTGIAVANSKSKSALVDRNRLNDSIEKIKGMLKSHPKFSKNPEEFHSTFEQIRAVAPHVAADHRLMKPIMEKHHVKGLTTDQLTHLSKLNDSMAADIREAKPDTIGDALKGSQLASSAYPILAERGAPFYQAGADFAARNISPLFKKASAEEEADSAIGRTTYRTYEFVKTAAKSNIMSSLKGMGKTFGTAFKGGLHNTWNTMGILSPPILIGAGLYAAQQIMKRGEEAERNQNILKSFDYVSKNSDYAKSNPKLVQEAFNTLKAFAPHVAERPLAAKTFVDLAAGREGIDAELLKQVSEVEKITQQIEPAHDVGTAITGMKDLFGIGHNIHKSTWGASKDSGILNRLK
jgi:hypothetical protein